MKANNAIKHALGALALSFGALGAAGLAQAAATIVVINANAPGIGFNDPTPLSPVGGNTGTTLGEQRLIAFNYAASIWAATVTSSVPIRVTATFEALPCTTNGAVLGAAGAFEISANFQSAPKANTWYPTALASKLSGNDEAGGDPHIIAFFNSRLGLSADCLPGSGFYLGLDNKHGAELDLVEVLLHELGHGLGFQTFTDDESGAQIDGMPSIWDHYLIDNRTNQLWINMTDAERAASGVSGGGLSWNGAGVTAAVPLVLARVSDLALTGPAAGAASGDYAVGDADFGPPLGTPAVVGQLMPVVDQANGAGLACTPLGAANALAVRNNIALIDRGSCPFVIKVKNAQDAGAIGVIIADNVAGAVAGLGGSDPSITIPAVRITQADGFTLKAGLTHRSRSASGVLASLGLNPTRFAGTDNVGRILLYTPLDYAPGSTVSHYTDAAKRNQLMEPFINSDLLHTVLPPYDLTFELLKDIGW